MTFLLDTNACIRLLRPQPSPIKDRFKTTYRWDVVVCSVVKCELYYGAHRSGRPAHNLQLVEELCETLGSFPFDDRAAGLAGSIRADLESAGMPIGPLDLQIAAIALVNDLTLVTHNTREFGRVPGLKVEDWEAPGP